jgi:nitroreductase
MASFAECLFPEPASLSGQVTHPTSQIMDFILTRRSIRSFRDAAVDEKTVEYLLRAAMQAPSAGNEQPWHFVVIRNRALLAAITTVHAHAAMLHTAALAILVCGEEGLEKHQGFWVQDCSAAVENCLLAAHTKGLGAVWLGVYPRQERMDGIRQLLKIPAQITPFALIAVGYPAEEKQPQDRYTAGRVRYDTWQK